jgi:hypothetical protein
MYVHTGFGTCILCRRWNSGNEPLKKTSSILFVIQVPHELHVCPHVRRLADVLLQTKLKQLDGDSRLFVDKVLDDGRGDYDVIRGFGRLARFGADFAELVLALRALVHQFCCASVQHLVSIMCSTYQ